MVSRRFATVAVALLVLSCWTGGGSCGETGMMTDEVARRVVREITPEVERLRGLTFKEPVEVFVIDDETSREYVMERLRQFDYEPKLRLAGEAYEILGLVPPGTDLLKSLLQILEEQAGGFYDPPRGAFYLLEDMPASIAPMLAAHELTHALEDQHFDLDSRLRRTEDDDDRIFASSAVHEGSATLLVGAYIMSDEELGEISAAELMQSFEVMQGAEIARLPKLLARQLLGPYFLGARFLAHGDASNLDQGYPKAIVDRAYRDGPSSSEQILHPDKYWSEGSRDEPRAVDLDGSGELLGRGWEMRGEGVLGELTLALLVGAETPVPLGPSGGASWTNEAASGWDGDRWQLWGRDDAAVVLLSTVWDTVEDAREFGEALPRSASVRFKQAGDRVALVAGETGRKKAKRLLSHMVRSRGGGVGGDLVSTPGTR